MTRLQNAFAAVEEFIRREEREARKRERRLKRRAGAGAAAANVADTGARPKKRQRAAEKAPPAEETRAEEKAPPAEETRAAEKAPPAEETRAAEKAAVSNDAAPGSSLIPTSALASGSSSSGLSSLEEVALEALSVVRSMRPLNANHITNPSMSNFEYKSHGGGNFRLTRLSTREVLVKMDENKLAMWPVKEYYEEKMSVVTQFLQRPEIEKRCDGLRHPFLRIVSAKMQACVREELVHKIFGYAKKPEMLFRQFLCTIGMRSNLHDDVYTWDFDPESWNRASYRLMPGCDSKGKPKITFV